MPLHSFVDLRKKLKPLFLGELAEYIYKRVAEVNIEKLDPKSCCLSASWLIHEALQALGIKSEIRRCEAYFYNKEGSSRVARYIISRKGINPDIIPALPKLDEEDRGYIVSIGVSKDDNPVDFHVILYFPQDNSVLDLTACQASRPQHKLIVKNYWESLDNLPKNMVFHFSTESLLLKYGQIATHPNLLKIFNHILKRICETLKLPIIRVKKIERVNKDGTAQTLH